MSELITEEKTVDGPKAWLSSPSGTQVAPESSPLTQVEVEELLEQLSAEARKRRRKRRLKRLILTGYILAVVFAMLLRFVFEHKLALKFPFFWGFWVLGGLGAASKFQKESVRKLAKAPDLRAVGYFVDALEFDDKDVVEEAVEALTVLLPQMNASDSHRLDEGQRVVLYRCLRGDRKKLILAILRALEQIGDDKAVSFVEELANAEPWRGRPPELVEAARAALPALKERVEKEREAHTLLRAAGENGAYSEVLLRPAGSGGDSSTDLLRPVEEDADVQEAA